VVTCLFAKLMLRNSQGSATVFDASFDDVFVVGAGTGGLLEAVFATAAISKGAKIDNDSFVWIVYDDVKARGETPQQYAERMRVFYATQWADVCRDFSVSHPHLEESMSKLQPRRQQGQLRGEWLEEVLKVNAWVHYIVRNNVPVQCRMLVVYKGSKYNHSCEPSLQTNLMTVQTAPVQTAAGAGHPVNINSNEDPCEIWVDALRDIPAGEEVTVSYLSAWALRQKVEYRREKLMKIWGFECVCARCTKQSAALELLDSTQIPPSTAMKRKNKGGYHDDTEKRSAQQNMAHADHPTLPRDTTPPLTPVLPQIPVTLPMPAILRQPMSMLLANPSDLAGDVLQLAQNSQDINASVLREAVHSLPVFRTGDIMREPAAASTTSATPAVEPRKSTRMSGRKRVPKVSIQQAAESMEYQYDVVAPTREQQNVDNKHEVQASIQVDNPTSSSHEVPPIWTGQLWREEGRRLPEDGISLLATLCAETAARDMPAPLRTVSPSKLVDSGKATTQSTQQCPLRDFLDFVVSDSMRQRIDNDKTRMMVLSVLFRLVQHVDQYQSTRGLNSPDLELLHTAGRTAFKFYSLLLQFVSKDRSMYSTPHGFEKTGMQHNPSYDYIARTRFVFFCDALVPRAMSDFVSFVTHDIPEMHFGGGMHMQHDLQWWHTNLQQEMHRYSSNSFTPAEMQTKNGGVYCIVRMLFVASSHPWVKSVAATAVAAALRNVGAGSTSSYATAI